jgi:transposase
LFAEIKDGKTTVTETVVTKRVSYKQEWTSYNAAQMSEKREFQALLFELCANVEMPIQVTGRPRIPISDVIFSAVFKVYSTVSGRRFMSDLNEAKIKGFVSEMPHYNTVSRYLENEELTAYLKHLITQSSLPLKDIESDFAVDSSGFATCQFTRWFNAKYGRELDYRKWLKVHLMCGTRTNIVTSAEISKAYANDSPYFQPLVEKTVQSGFKMAEISADKAYLSAANLELSVQKGAKPFIPFKSNSLPDNKGKTWARLYHFYRFHFEEFEAHYHKRSNVESTFSMIKMKFGERLRSKTETAQINEALCKVLAHNICVVIKSMHQFGIEASFGSDM